VTRITILSPTDVKPGAVDPKGRVVKTSTLYADEHAVLVGVTFENGDATTLMWPNGAGWQPVKTR
jgi:hypothetical protein